MSRRLWKLAMSSFACSLEQTGGNPTISSYWWIFPRGNILIHWVIHWANEPSVMHCHPPWGPALKRERDVLRPSYVQVFYQKEMNFGNSFFFFPRERQNTDTIKSSSIQPFPALALAPFVLGCSFAPAEPWCCNWQVNTFWDANGKFCIQMKCTWPCAPP